MTFPVGPIVSVSVLYPGFLTVILAVMRLPRKAFVSLSDDVVCRWIRLPSAYQRNESLTPDWRNVGSFSLIR